MKKKTKLFDYLKLNTSTVHDKFQSINHTCYAFNDNMENYMITINLIINVDMYLDDLYSLDGKPRVVIMPTLLSSEAS